MKKNIKYLGIIALLLVQFACMDKKAQEETKEEIKNDTTVVQVEETKKEESVKEEEKQEVKENFVVKSLKYESPKENEYRYDIEIPQIEGKTNEDITYFNTTLQEEARYIMENMATSKEDGNIQEAIMNYTDLENSFGVKSFSVITSVYTGGAHNINKIESYNLTKKDGSLLDPEKMITDEGVTYFNMAINDIVAKNEDGIYFSDATPDISKAVIVFDKDDMVFIFQNYDIAPYSSGMPEFRFPKGEISKYLELEK